LACCWRSQVSSMTRMLVTVLLYALATAPGSAQNTVSQELLALSEDQRNAAFTRLLQASDRDCDQVIRTLFAGDGLGLDDWEALCRNRTSYSLSVPGEWDASITVLSCRELSATRKRLLGRRGGGEKKPAVA
jgi:hypothetical protein